MSLLPESTSEYNELVDSAGKRYRKKRQVARPAITNYRVLDSDSNAALVLCQPETGAVSVVISNSFVLICCCMGFVVLMSQV